MNKAQVDRGALSLDGSPSASLGSASMSPYNLRVLLRQLNQNIDEIERLRRELP